MPPKKSSWKSKSLWPTLKETLCSGRDLVVYDLETTGLSSANDRIIEIAAVKYKLNADFEMTECGVYHQYINPERALSDAIVNLTGITGEMLADKPTESECVKDIIEFFDGCIVSGYNIENFDNKFMNEMYARYGTLFAPCGSVDCIKMARNRLTKDVDVENYKLATVGAFFGIDFQAHSAIEDTRATGKLAQIFLREYANEERESEETKSSGTLRPAIGRISFWPGFKGFSRIYVNMNIGSVYYDIRSSSWGGKDDLDVNTIDMEWLESEVFRITGANNEKEFSAFRGEISA